MQEKIQIFSPVKQRILQFADTLGVSRREFYLKTGISRGTLESPTGINEETLAKVIAAYRNISPTWLITGAGQMLMDENSTHSTIDLRTSENNYCKHCKEKDRTISALEKTISYLEKINRSLEIEQEKSSPKTDKKDPYQKTG